MDAILATLTILLSDTAPGGLVSMLGTDPTSGLPAIYGGQLPEHYNPEVQSTEEPKGNGPAVTMIVKGGTTHPEIPLQDVAVQITVWTGVNQNFNARSISNRVFQVLDGLVGVNTGGGGLVKRILASVPAQDSVDPDTGWVMLLNAFDVMIMDNGQYPASVTITPTETAAQYTDAAIAAISEIDGNGNFS